MDLPIEVNYVTIILTKGRHLDAFDSNPLANDRRIQRQRREVVVKSINLRYRLMYVLVRIRYNQAFRFVPASNV